MTKNKMANRYSPEVRARAVRMVFEHQGSYETQAGAIAAIAPKIGCIPQTLSGWVKQAEKDSGMRGGVTTEERDRIKTLGRENRELRHANESRPRHCTVGNDSPVTPYRANLKTVLG